MAANRANAQKSTGPRTRAGKDRSRLNGLIHGLTASLSLLPGEDPRTFRRLADGVYADFRPRGQAEVVLVDQYVTIAWKLRRLGAAERAIGADHFVREAAEWFRHREDAAWAKRNPKLFNAEDLAEVTQPMGEPPDPATAAELLAEELHGGAGPLLRLLELETRLRATLANTLRQLKDLRALRTAQEELEDGAEPWQPGAWDPDGERLTRCGPKGEEEEEEGDDDGDDDGDEEIPAAKGQAAAVAAVEPAPPRAPELQTEPGAPAARPGGDDRPQVAREAGDAARETPAAPTADVAPRAPGEAAQANPDGEAPDAPPMTPTAPDGGGKSPS